MCDIVQNCFDKAIEQFYKKHLHEEANALSEATLHWLPPHWYF